MRRVATAIAGVLLAGTFWASPASAQGASFFTTGHFNTSPVFPTCNSLVSTPVAVCSGAGFTLTFTGSTGTNIGCCSINLGNLFLTGLGSATVPPGAVTFTLMVNQTSPTGGTATTAGSITGTVETSPPGPSNVSTLVWRPSPSSFSIGGVDYTLSFDTGAPAAGMGYNIPINLNESIGASIVLTPEPASMTLLATGLVGLAGAVARKRKALLDT